MKDPEDLFEEALDNLIEWRIEKRFIDSLAGDWSEDIHALFDKIDSTGRGDTRFILFYLFIGMLEKELIELEVDPLEWDRGRGYRRVKYEVEAEDDSFTLLIYDPNINLSFKLKPK